ncbi:hypothetical protein JNUCC1_01794 [Lentibacillus sp. JNUCC-1]|uniref:DUF3139 domain-containing protein n=1 Tax=Lentibacillus sp. JNUCC-1 TaxID=2654513 RepID=UPI0012E8C8F3|nr:DUF3139 domain-containing protein [Lentibacillus sp. JNUCC-1]MUV37986.1 hypothetical protein [Lentibacillus sp. JNUCC-1]
MMKGRNVVLIVLGALLLFNGGRWFLAYQAQQELKEDTLSYLTEQGYDTENDIEDITVVNVGRDGVVYSAVVNFTDEPEVDYFYAYRPNTKEITKIDEEDHRTNK